MTSRGVLPGLLSSFGLLVLAFPRARGFGRVPSFCGPIRLASAWGSGAPVLSVAGFRGAVATRGESLGVVLHVCAGQGGGAADCTGGPSAALGRALKGALAPALPLPAVTPARACPRPGVTLRVWVHPVRQLVARPGEVGPYWVGPAQGSDCTGFGLRGFRLRGCGCVSIRAAGVRAHQTVGPLPAGCGLFAVVQQVALWDLVGIYPPRGDEFREAVAGAGFPLGVVDHAVMSPAEQDQVRQVCGAAV